jgi:lipase maturation factor 1
MPRLDWQMWFAALEVERGRVPSWFFRFEHKLVEGSPDVLELLREHPFPVRPPRYLRAQLADYTLSRSGSRDWWSRDVQSVFLRPLSADDLKLEQDCP